MTPNTAQEIKSQRSLLDLNTFEDVTLVKVGTFKPVTDAQEALARVANSTERFLEIVNTGLRALELNALKDNDTIPWRVLGEDGKPGEVFNGTPADPAIVNPLVLNIAKAACGYLTAKNADEKRKAKDAAIDMIKSNPLMLEGIKKQSAVAAATQE